MPRMPTAETTRDAARPSFAEALRVWTKIGLLSFGGPAGQIAMMHRMLVEENRWIGNERFLHALSYCNLLPGPEAQQLAIYVGWLLHGTPGGIAAGTLFVLPGFLVVMVLSALYAAYRHVPAVDALFWGLKAAVLAVVVDAVLRIGRKSLKTPFAVGLAAAAFVAIFFYAAPFPLVVLGAGVLGWLGGDVCPGLLGAACPGWLHLSAIAHGPAGGTGGAPDGVVDEILDDDAARLHPSLARALRVLGVWLPLWLGPVLVLGTVLGWESVWARMSLFFSKMAVVTFGGAYAVLAYVAQEAVAGHGWLTPEDMLNGLGLAETTPGPLILVLQYVGFLAAYRDPGALTPMLAGTLGATLTVWVTFTPCFLWIFLGAPYIERVRSVRALTSALSGITAAVVGVVLNLALWFALHVIFSEVSTLPVLGARVPLPSLDSLDPAAFLLALAAMLALLSKKLGMLAVLACCAAAGAVYRLLF